MGRNLLLDVSKSPAVDEKPQKGISRRRLLGGAALAAPAVAGLATFGRSGESAVAEAPAAAAHGHASGEFPHATFAAGRQVDHAAQRLPPDRAAARLRLRPTSRLASGRVLREWDDRRPGPGDRNRPRRPLRGLDLQRPRPGPDPARPRGRAAAGPFRQRLRTSAHDAFPRRALRPDGRDAGDRREPRRRPDRTGRGLHLRVRRRSLRPPPLPLPRRRRSPRTSPAASTALSSSTQSRGGPKPTRW